MQNAERKQCETKKSPHGSVSHLPVAFCILHCTSPAEAGHYALVLRVRSTATTLTTSSPAAATAAGVGRGKRERDELRTGRRSPSRADDDELTAVMHVGHRETDLRTGKRRLPDLFTSCLVVGMEDSLSASAFTSEHECLRDHDARLRRAAGLRDREPLQRRVVLHRRRRVAIRDLPGDL